MLSTIFLTSARERTLSEFYYGLQYIKLLSSLNYDLFYVLSGGYTVF